MTRVVRTEYVSKVFFTSASHLENQVRPGEGVGIEKTREIAVF